MKIKIGKNIIGKNKCFIIAEVGVNHNGDINLAKKLIDEGVAIGADAIKFQTFKSENLVRDDVEIVGYQKQNIGHAQKQIEMLKKLELSNADFIELKKYCDDKNITFLSTPHTEDAIEFLNKIVPAFKVGSGDLDNFPFLERVAKKKKPVILSSGMADLKEIDAAVRLMKKNGNDKIIVLHCTTSYPCPLEDVNLRAMETIKKQTGTIVGYSDHTEGITVPVLAVGMGANVIEKHFTLDKNLPGPDHKASLTPEEFRQMVVAIRDAETAMGSEEKKPTLSEKQMKKVIRKSIVARVDIPKNTVIKNVMIEVKRPADGIPPKDFQKVIGKRASKDIKKGQTIKWHML